VKKSKLVKPTKQREESPRSKKVKKSKSRSPVKHQSTQEASCSPKTKNVKKSPFKKSESKMRKSIESFEKLEEEAMN